MTEPTGPAAVLSRVTRMSYQRADAQDSWRRIFALFGEHLAD